ncbi:MAG: hypothetical protein IGR93_15700 [Hydrococcus sp. C42_A2020_068]|nr:hypothetical protein [Hydrococcus sp. C42_A2020_068]
MNSDSEDPFTSLFRQFFPFLFGLLDDALIVGLSRLGCKVPWLEALSLIVISCTTMYLVIQFWKHGIPNLIAMWQEFQQQPEVSETSKH